VAFVLNKKIVKDTEEYSNYAYGITLPVKRGNTGYFEQAFSSFEQAKSNLRNLLLTKQGERIMQPNFGTGLHSLLFEQMTSQLERDLEETIVKSVGYWLPYINVKDIEVTMTDEMKDMHRAEIYVTFTVGNQIELQELTFIVKE
jgi:phage baseplate assembly protein W